MGVGLYSVSCGYGCGYGFGGFASLIAMVLALRAREALRMVMGGKVFSGRPPLGSACIENVLRTLKTKAGKQGLNQPKKRQLISTQGRRGAKIRLDWL